MSQTKTLHPPRAIGSMLRFAFAALLSCTAALTAAHAANPNQPFCFPEVINVPGPTWQVPPNVNDGLVSDDRGWTSARRHVFQNGTPVFDVAIQGLRNAGSLFFSFEVNHDQQWDPKDEIYVAFDPTGMPADRRLLRIQPVLTSGQANPTPIAYWHGFPWSGLGAGPPAGTRSGVSTSGTAPNVSWFVELEVPRAAFAIPPSGKFGIFFNVVPKIDDLAFHYQYRWPEGTSPMLADPLGASGPGTWADTSKWGEATTAATSCNGVSIASTDIYTDNSPPNMINRNTSPTVAANKFHALVRNSGVDATGAAVAASNVRATFKIANFGLPSPSSWQTIGATGGTTNPTSPGVTVGPGSTADLTMEWKLTSAQAGAYNTADTDHQCILVELDTSPLSNTLFASKSAWNNMNFGFASRFDTNAQIDPRGWPSTAPGRSHKLKLMVTSQVDELKRDDVLRQMKYAADKKGPALGNGGRWQDLSRLAYFPAAQDDNAKAFVRNLDNRSARVSQAAYLVHGCRHTGLFLDVGGGQKSELCERVGSYAVLGRHASLGQPIAWTYEITGPGVKRDRRHRNQYQVAVPAKKPVSVLNRVVATENRKPDRKGLDQPR